MIILKLIQMPEHIHRKLELRHGKYLTYDEQIEWLFDQKRKENKKNAFTSSLLANLNKNRAYL